MTAPPSLDPMTGGGSPFFGDLKQDKDIRSSFLHALALTLLAAIVAGIYYVYSILEPFIVPLLWAVLTGVLLHPYKKMLTVKLKLSLVRLQQNDLNIVFVLSQNTIRTIDKIGEYIGEYFLMKWKIFLGLLVLTVTSYSVYINSPGAFHILLSSRDFLMDELPSLFSNVQNVHLGLSCALALSTLLIIPQYKVCCSMLCLITWMLLFVRIFNYLWPPLLYVLLIILISGNFVDGPEGDQPDGGESRLRSLIFSLLRRFNIIRGAADESDAAEETHAHGPASSTPIPDKGVDEPILESTPKVDLKLGVIPHPGVSALKKEHGVLQSRPNISEIGKPSVGISTPKSRLGRSFRFAKRKSSLATEIHHDSMRYIYGVLWCCGLVQLWLHPSLLFLLPGPIFYSLIKRIFIYSGLTDFVGEKLQSAEDSLNEWIDTNSDVILPPPVVFVGKQIKNIERTAIQITTSHVDSIVTILLILSMILLTAFASIFIIIQVYAESAYLLQSLASIASSLDMKQSHILTTLNITLPDNSSMEGVMDEAYSYGRAWISTTLQQTLEDTDPDVRVELENKVLELWDRTYQYWVLKQDPVGPKISSDAITTSLGEVMDKIYHTHNLFNITAIQIFIRNNMGTLTSILEHIWSLFQGNVIFLSDTIMGMGRVLLHSGSGVINFMFGIIIYLTALFYLLSNSGSTFIPIEILGQYTMFNAPGVGSILQTAVNSVLFITVKMSSFYLLWTYLTHTVFQATIVVLPMLFSSFIAAVPFTGQYIVSLPASLELWLLQDRPVAAILLMIFQVAPSWLVDAAIYSEMKGGIHPWFTGLAVVGGVYVFGVVGAIYGPLVLCVLYVIVNLYTTFMQELEPPTPVGYKSLRTPFNRSDTVQ